MLQKIGDRLFIITSLAGGAHKMHEVKIVRSEVNERGKTVGFYVDFCDAFDLEEHERTFYVGVFHDINQEASMYGTTPIIARKKFIDAQEEKYTSLTNTLLNEFNLTCQILKQDSDILNAEKAYKQKEKEHFANMFAPTRDKILAILKSVNTYVTYSEAFPDVTENFVFNKKSAKKAIISLLIEEKLEINDDWKLVVAKTVKWE